MKKRFGVAAAFLLGLLIAAPAYAQFGALEGDVKDPEGKPMVGAQVVLDRKDIKGTYKTKTDKKGHWFHGGLPLGTFKVSLMDGAKVLYFFDNIRVRPGDPTVINIDLKAEQMRQQAAQAGIPVQQQAAAPGQQQEAPKLSKEQLAKMEEEAKKRTEARQKQEKLNSKFGEGMEALKVKNCDVAVDALKAAAEVDVTQHVVFANLADAFICQSKTKSGDERKAAVQGGVDAYKKAIELKGDDPSYHNNYGLALVQAGAIAEAQAELTKAAQLDPPGAAKYYFNLGAVLTNIGKIDEAGEAFKQAVTADPTYSEAYYQYGIALMGKATLDAKTGKSTPAPGTIDAFNKYLELAPAGANAEVAKAMIQMLGGQVQTEIKSEKAKPAAAAPKKKT